MARYAVLSEDMLCVEEVIVINETQIDEMEQALGRTLLDATPLDLSVGDFYNGVNWTRNIDGEQLPLPIGDSADAEELLAILEGGAEDGIV